MLHVPPLVPHICSSLKVESEVSIFPRISTQVPAFRLHVYFTSWHLDDTQLCFSFGLLPKPFSSNGPRFGSQMRCTSRRLSLQFARHCLHTLYFVGDFFGRIPQPCSNCGAPVSWISYLDFPELFLPRSQLQLSTSFCVPYLKDVFIPHLVPHINTITSKSTLVGDISRGFHRHVLTVVLCQIGVSHLNFSASFLQPRAQPQLSTSFYVLHLGGIRDLLVPPFSFTSFHEELVAVLHILFTSVA